RLRLHLYLPAGRKASPTYWPMTTISFRLVLWRSCEAQNTYWLRFFVLGSTGRDKLITLVWLAVWRGNPTRRGGPSPPRRAPHRRRYRAGEQQALPRMQEQRASAPAAEPVYPGRCASVF